MKKNTDSFNRIFIIYLMLSIIFLFLNNNYKMNIGRFYINSILYPVQKAFVVFDEYINYRRENIELKKELVELKKNIYDNYEILEENKRLKKLLEFKNQHSEIFKKWDYIVARVIGYNPNLEYNSIMIDKGSNSGIKKNMPVISKDGLVGKVFSVGPFSSIVLLITDRNYEVSIKLQKSRVYSIMRWMEGNIFELMDISLIDEIKEDDIVLTSGQSDIFPANLPVGKIMKLEESDKYNRRRKVLIRSFVDFNKLEDVIIIKKENEIFD